MPDNSLFLEKPVKQYLLKHKLLIFLPQKYRMISPSNSNHARAIIPNHMYSKRKQV